MRLTRDVFLLSESGYHSELSKPQDDERHQPEHHQYHNGKGELGDDRCIVAACWLWYRVQAAGNTRHSLDYGSIASIMFV